MTATRLFPWIASLLLVAAAPLAAQVPGMSRDAGTGKLMVDTPYVCPLTGEKFTESQRAAVYRAGTYLDLKPYGSFDGEFPPLPACPDSGLVLVTKTYTPEQVEKLRSFVAAPDYARMREQETRAYMAAKQVEHLGEPQARIADRWLKATWSARDDAEYRRTAEEALRQMDKLGAQAEAGKGDWITAQLAGLELQRRLGQFDNAAARLAGLKEQAAFQQPFFVKLLALQGELIERRDSTAQKMPR